jgi:hypothetical protein
VWEKVDHFGFVLSVHNLLSSFLQEGDNWLMAWFIAAGYNSSKLLKQGAETSADFLLVQHPRGRWQFGGQTIPKKTGKESNGPL